MVRDAFAGAIVTPRPLSELVATLGGGSVAVASEVSHNHKRLVVDEYRKEESGRYALQVVATDLYRSDSYSCSCLGVETLAMNRQP